MNMIAGLTDIVSTFGTFKLSSEQLHRVAVPKSITANDIRKIQRDCAILLERAKASPKKIQSLLSSANSGDLSAAQRIAKELKLTEADFEKEGGGFIWLLVIAIILLSASEAR